MGLDRDWTQVSLVSEGELSLLHLLDIAHDELETRYSELVSLLGV